MKKRKYILKVRRARRSFLIFYIMALAIIFLLIYLYATGNNPSWIALIVAIIFIKFLIKLTEIERWKDWWAISDTSIVQSTGIFNKNVREVDFSSISDLDLDQSFFKRFFNYGNVNVRLFLNETSIKIADIARPSDFIEILQGLISERKKEVQNHGIRRV